MLSNISQKRRHAVKRIIVDRIEIPKKIDKEFFDNANIKLYGNQSIQSRKDIVRQLSQEYLHDSSVHGVKYFGNLRLKTSICGKIFWALIMICSFMRLVYIKICQVCAILIFLALTLMLWQFWIRYNANPTRTVIESFQAPIYMIPFPAVTLCPLIPPLVERRRKILLQLRLPHNMDNKTAMFLLRYGPAFANERAPGGKTHLSNLKALLKINRLTLVDFLKLLRPCEDLFDFCSWEGKPRNCSELFKTSYTFAGICCSFNYRLEDYIETGRTRNDTDFVRTTSFGGRSGLTIILHRDLLVENDGTGDFIRFSTNSVGIVVFAHHPLEYVGSTSSRQILQATQELRVAVNPYIKHKLANYYGPDAHGVMVSQCADEKTQLKYFPTYRYTNCFISCSIDAVFQICNCVPYYYMPMAKKNSLRICNWEDFECLYVNKDNIRIVQNIVTENFTCECRNLCRNEFYETQSSSIVLNGDQDFNVSPFYQNRTQVQAVLRVFINSETFVEMDTIPVADELYLLASIGGIFSLFVGCSFISAVEIFYFIGLFFRSNSNKKSK